MDFAIDMVFFFIRENMILKSKDRKKETGDIIKSDSTECFTYVIYCVMHKCLAPLKDPKNTVRLLTLNITPHCQCLQCQFLQINSATN